MRAFRRSQVVGAEVSPLHTPATLWVTTPGSAELLHPDGGPILAAVDGRPGGWHALEWAAAEAAARQCSLRIVHAVDSQPVSWDAFGTFSPAQWDADIEAVGAQILREAAGRARAITALPITTQLHLGPPAAAVLQEAGGYALAVLGRGRTPRQRRSVTTSVSQQVARRTSGAVAIVELFDGTVRGRSAERVVVGFDRTGMPTAALGFAFRAAQRRGVGVTTLQVWARGSTRLDTSVRHALASCRDVFPDVDVQQRFAAGPIGPALVAESAGAALVVLSSRAHRGLRRQSFKSVLSVLRSAQSPVVVIGKLPASERLSHHDAGPS